MSRDLAAGRDLSSGVVRAWVGLYTRGLPAALAAERRAEIDADLWEEAVAAFRFGQVDRLPAQRLSRLVRGMPSDITWRLDRARAADTREGGISMRPTPIQWALLAAGAAMFGYALIATVPGLLTPDPTRWDGWGPYGFAAAAALGLAGIAIAIVRPGVGLVLTIAAAIIAGLAAPWMGPFAAIAVIPAAVRWLGVQSQSGASST